MRACFRNGRGGLGAVEAGLDVGGSLFGNNLGRSVRDYGNGGSILKRIGGWRKKAKTDGLVYQSGEQG